MFIIIKKKNRFNEEMKKNFNYENWLQKKIKKDIMNHMRANA